MCQTRHISLIFCFLETVWSFHSVHSLSSRSMPSSCHLTWITTIVSKMTLYSSIIAPRLSLIYLHGRIKYKGKQQWVCLFHLLCRAVSDLIEGKKALSKPVRDDEFTFDGDDVSSSPQPSPVSAEDLHSFTVNNERDLQTRETIIAHIDIVPSLCAPGHHVSVAIKSCI